MAETLCTPGERLALAVSCAVCPPKKVWERAMARCNSARVPTLPAAAASLPPPPRHPHKAQAQTLKCADRVRRRERHLRAG